MPSKGNLTISQILRHCLFNTLFFTFNTGRGGSSEQVLTFRRGSFFKKKSLISLFAPAVGTNYRFFQLPRETTELKKRFFNLRLLSRRQ